ncbi:type II toxin-antitoxin system RatA family toxin [Zavarzinia compransoris]|uniref:Ubiquinone-binding protein n=1 Tax=Zavarzinia compransoris TaxID=1264899 RepID=A0A317E9G1_9PROT|nr:type II toxin-antitoxin system RatA family toxin [Zavarzinia compransoris]PWR23777.1 ubiquinone-binding protein [Zavarzinia compransoris]TDP48007.1 coenzyme Q-binding protein COQ10 [Zavarzinia compransoris]
MPRYAEVKTLPYSAAQLFQLVADIAKYPEFLPWCVGARIRAKSDDLIIADLMIGYKAFRERFTSAVSLNPPDEIEVSFTEGPFSYLKNHWRFLPTADGSPGCVIDFLVDFEFKNKVYQQVIGGVFEDAAIRMIAAFETRAHALYGAGAAA